MKINLQGLEAYNIPSGEYDLQPGPTGREMNRFRREAELTPAELTNALEGGGLDIVRLYAYVALERGGHPLEAANVLDIPFEDLRKIKAIQEPGDPSEEEIDPKIPPTLGLALNGSEPEDAQPAGTTSVAPSARQD